MKNRKKREKLGELFFDLCKYSGAIIVIGKLINREIGLVEFTIGIIISIGLGLMGYYIAPKD
jgi:hypothetical protein